jgi:hypothetical protein
MEESRIVVRFAGRAHALCLHAYGDCCSVSWFEYVRPFLGMVGKRLRSMNDDGTNVVSTCVETHTGKI